MSFTTSGTDNLLDLTYLPPGSEDGRVNTITVGVSDGFNGADDDDQTLSIEISVTEKQPDPITSSFVSITVAENSTDCSQDDVASGCSVAGVVCRTPFPSVLRAALTVETPTTRLPMSTAQSRF